MAFLTKTGVEVVSSQASGAAQSDLDARIAFIADSPGKRIVRETSRPRDGMRTTTFNRLREALYCPGSSYGLSTFVGLLTYVVYGSLNDAWSNPALVAVSIFLLLTIPLYSKLSNRIEFAAANRTGLETGGRIARYTLQLLDNLFLLWMFVAGQVVDPAGLEGIGGFFATAAWITIVSQGGQYIANGLARRGVGDADRNVVLAISISAIINALAVSGVIWIQPVYIVVSLCFGTAIFGMGLVIDARLLHARSKAKIL